jgi:SMODS and SLOG-associating 2TM effector domain 2
VSGSERNRDVDLEASQLPTIGWDKKAAALSELCSWAENFAHEAIDWYLSEKKRKARWSRSLRLLAIILATLGGATPLAALTAGRPALGNWGFVLIALAAGCLAYDRFSGYSSAWLRYMAAATELRSQLSDFQLQWARTVAAFDGKDPSNEATLEMIDSVHSFVRSINETIRSETQSWLDEFNSNLSELKSSVGTNS